MSKYNEEPKDITRRGFIKGVGAAGLALAMPEAAFANESPAQWAARYRGYKQLPLKFYQQKDPEARKAHKAAEELQNRLGSLRAKFTDNVNGLENQGWDDAQIIKNAEEIAKLRLENIEKGYALFGSMFGDSRYDTVIGYTEKALTEGIPGSMNRSRKHQLYYRHFLRWFTNDVSWLDRPIVYKHP